MAGGFRVGQRSLGRGPGKGMFRSQVVAVELSREALPYIMKNAIRNQVDGRLLVVQADFCRPVVRSGTFHVVVANPPYISREEYLGLSSEVSLFEPRSALTPGDTGLEQFALLAAQAWQALLPEDGFSWRSVAGRGRMLCAKSNRTPSGESRGAQGSGGVGQGGLGGVRTKGCFRGESVRGKAGTMDVPSSHENAERRHRWRMIGGTVF